MNQPKSTEGHGVVAGTQPEEMKSCGNPMNTNVLSGMGPQPLKLWGEGGES